MEESSLTNNLGLTNNLIKLDGSHGEGGGQIVRTALALSCITGKPFEIFNIRKGRCKNGCAGGLKAQHLYCIKALEQLCNGHAEGVQIGSETVKFEPGKLKSKLSSLEIDVGTAGSITLVLQSLLLPAFFADKQLRITLKGGTDVSWSMPIDYLREVLLPQLKKFCEKIELKVAKRGYFPAGGGVVELLVKPRWHLNDFPNFEEFQKEFSYIAKKINLSKAGEIVMIKGVSHASKNLEGAKVAERQAEAAVSALKVAGLKNFDISCEYCDTISTGSGICLWAVLSGNDDEFNPVRIGADALGEKSKPAENVGKEAAKNLLAQLDSKAPVDEHLADNLIPWMALAQKSKISAAKITEHAKTNIHVVEQFLGKIFEVDEENKEIKS